MVTASHVNVSISQTKHYAQSLLRCSVALNNSALVWSLARSQSVYSESGPAVDNSSYPLLNTHTEWVHWYRQETIHCSHVLTENMDKLQAVTFTHGCERDVKQASHIAAAGCVCASVCIKLAEIDHVIPFVHISPYTPCAITDLFPYLVMACLCRHLVRSHWGTSCSPATPTSQTASPAQPKISHRPLLCCRPSYKTSKYSLFCGPDTTSSPISRGEEENSEKIYIIAD